MRAMAETKETHRYKTLLRGLRKRKEAMDGDRLMCMERTEYKQENGRLES